MFFLTVALLPSVSLAGVAPVLIKPVDVVGSPGQTVNVVVSSFRSRGVGQGQMCLRARGNNGVALFSALQSVAVRSGLNDAVVPAPSFDLGRQEVTVSFSSPSATINEEAGVFAVFTFTVDPGVTTGLLYDLEINQLTLLDGSSQPIETDRRRGHLTTVPEIHGLADFEVDADEVLAGEEAFFGAKTEEPFAIGSGTVVFLYDPAIAAGPPVVTMDQALGMSVLTAVVEPAAGGLRALRVEFDSDDGSLNATLSGVLITVTLPTLGSPFNQPKDTSPVDFVAALTVLFDPNGDEILVQLKGDVIKFEDPTEVFDGDFEDGDPREWSEEVGS